MKISNSSTLEPDRYTKALVESRKEDGTDERAAAECLIEIASDGVELDLGGAVLDGDDFKGFGIHVHDCEGVTIRNGTIKGFYYGIRAQNVTKLSIENCIVSDNHNPSDAGWLPDTIDPVEEGFGGGIYLRRVSGSLIQGNDLNNNFNGMDLVLSNGNTIKGNNASGNGNVGIHLLGSSRNTIEENRADHCIRFTGPLRYLQKVCKQSGGVPSL